MGKHDVGDGNGANVMVDGKGAKDMRLKCVICPSCAAVRRTSMPSARDVGLRLGVHAVRARD